MFRHRFYVRTIVRVFEINVKNPASAQQKNSSNEALMFDVHVKSNYLMSRFPVD